MAEESTFESKTPFNVATYLKENGIRDVTCETFEGKTVWLNCAGKLHDYNLCSLLDPASTCGNTGSHK